MTHRTGRACGACALLVLSALAGCEKPETITVERIERGNLVIEGIPQVPGALEERLQQYQNTRSAGFVDWDPEGRGLLIATRFGEVSQLHHVAGPMQARRQITFYDEPVTSAVFAPEPSPHDGLLFTKDRGGDENYQIHFFDRGDGRVRMLSDGEARNESPVWTNAGDRFAFRSNRRNGTDWDIWIAAPDGDEPEMIFEGDGFWFPTEFSPDDTHLALLKYVSITDSRLVLLDLANGETTDIRVGEEPAFYAPVAFSTDGSSLYFVSDAGSEFRTLRRYDLASGEVAALTGDIEWNVESADLSPDGAMLAFAVNEGGRSSLHVRSTDGWQPVPFPSLPAGIIGGLEFSPDSRSLAFTLSRATAPADVFVYDFVGRSLEQWTASEVGGLDPEGFVAPRLVSFESFDDLEVPAFVFEPEGPGPHPVLISIHGGPEGQYRPGYSSFVQYLVREMGVAVVSPNVRGSSGYGKTYVGLDNGRSREDSVKDIGALIDWIAADPSLDEDNVVIYGGSYGGYMVLASMVHYSDRLKGGIDIVGISNFVTFLENTQDYRKAVRRPEYGDERDPDMRVFLESISPLNHVEQITRPMFVIQGLNDPRVPVTESEQMVRRLRENGNEVWYLLAKDEGHGFRKKSNRDYQTAATMLFLERLFAQE